MTTDVAIGQNQIRVSALNMNPSNPMHTSDLDKITHNCGWFIATGDLNAKHLFWNSRCVNSAGNVLYHYTSQLDYSVIVLDLTINLMSSTSHYLNS